MNNKPIYIFGHKNTDTDLTCDKAVSIVVNKEVTEDLVLMGLVR